MIERKTFTFDGENSADYGLYISGDSVYNAPNREIDMVSIPGRNGQLAIDMGRYENITVTYPAFVIADTQAEFREKIRRIRNWLCSKTSYQRLTDDYNPESFRLGLYKSGLEVEPIFYNRCGEFEMSFDCQPQRFLFTGEEVFTLGEWGETETYSGSIVSFEGTETTAIKTLNASIVPKQSGSGDPSPSNVRPISGTDTVNVTVSNLNYIDESTNESGAIDANGNNTTNASFNRTQLIPIKNGIDATFKVFSAPASSNIRIHGYSANGSWLRQLALVYTTGSDMTQAITIGDDVYYIRISYPTNALGMVLLCQGTAPSTMITHQGDTYTTSLGQTVYGGTLDVVSGKLIIDSAKIVYDGTLPIALINWAPSSNGVGWAYGYIRSYNKIVSDTVVPKIYSDKLKASSYGDMFNGRVTNAVGVYSNNSYGIFIRTSDTSLTTVEAVNAYLSANPITVVYELATPIEIQLTPTEVKTLLGNNNIWANSGTVEVEIGENPYILVNPTKFEACPIFEVEGAGTLSIGDTTLTISNTGTTIIDTEMMEAYEDDNGAIISRNDEVEGGFPTLNSGVNTIDTDGLTSVKVTPKWWEL